MRYLLDTNIVSQFAKPHPDPKVSNWIAQHNDTDLYICCITLAELHSGVEQMPAGKKRDLLRRWLDDDLLEAFTDRILFITPDTARRYGGLLAKAKKAGYTPSSMDVLIASIAAENGMAVATLDADFKQIDVELALL